MFKKKFDTLKFTTYCKLASASWFVRVSVE